MLPWTLYIWEGNQIKSNMTKHSVCIKIVSDCPTNLKQVNWRQRRLWTKTSCINKLCTLELVKRPNKYHLTIRLNHEWYWRTLKLVYLTEWRCSFDNAADFAKFVKILLPVFIQRRHCNFYFPGQNFRNYLLKSLNNGFGHFHFLFPQFDDCPYLFYIKTSVTTTIKLIIYLENPHIYIKVLSDQLSECGFKLSLVINVHRTYRVGDSTTFKDTFGTWLWLKCSRYGWVATHDRYS